MNAPKTLSRLFALFSIAIVLAYAALEWRGVNMLPTSERSQVPPSVRSSPGGYRTYHSYRGFHGGK